VTVFPNSDKPKIFLYGCLKLRVIFWRLHESSNCHSNQVSNKDTFYLKETVEKSII